MKKNYTLFAGVALLATFHASAEIVNTGKIFTENALTIPNRQFFVDKSPQAVSKEYIGGDHELNSEALSITFYDNKFNEVKKIVTPVYPEVTATKSVSNSKEGPVDVYVTDINENAIWHGYASEGEFTDLCEQNGFTRTVNHDGEVWYVCADDASVDVLNGCYYYYEYFGNMYPTSAYVLRDGTGYNLDIQYEYREWGFIGYGDSMPQSESRRPMPQFIYPVSADCGDMYELIVTQTLFNTDDKYEWIIPIYEAVDCSYEDRYEKVDGKEVKGTGFKVVSEDGSVVATVKFPDGYFYDNDFYLYYLGSDYYLSVAVGMDGSEGREFYEIIYAVTPGSSSINQVAVAKNVSISPRTPHRGTPVTVSLGTQAGDRCRVSVVSMSGRIVDDRFMEPGATSTAINTDRLEAGMYIINVNDGKSTREAAKIIVR